MQGELSQGRSGYGLIASPVGGRNVVQGFFGVHQPEDVTDAFKHPKKKTELLFTNFAAVV